jgi:D-alanyl-lipoteichoic acid acyltransferase DltB (MBOAT superfamily)
MTLTHILVFLAAAVIYLLLLPARWRAWAFFLGSLVAVYWLQPPLRIRTLDFLFPTATLVLVVLSWLVSRKPDQRWTRQDTVTAGLMAGCIFLLSLGRYLVPAYRITPSTPPAPLNVLVGLGGAAAVGLLVYAWAAGRRWMVTPFIVVITLLLVVLKTESFSEAASRFLRGWQGQPTTLASATELQWLGFSYVAFRLIHTLRDGQSGKLPDLSLREYVTYVIFFPSFTAGPIDRAERFLPELRALPGRDPARLAQGGMRIAVGIGKKFVVADSLAYLALNATKADQTTSTGWLWIMLYAYAFQLYFDFSGYSDIAIGIGQLFGIKLPENFNQPYLKRNITLFWQSWHMTLSQWVRFYVFMPLSRFLLMRKRKPSPIVLALIGQMATMLVIGLWHGVTWGFVVWGLWHGVGLFIHKLWSDYTRPFYVALREHPRLEWLISGAGTVFTFHFAVLGWVWFALPQIGMSWDVFGRLFGM